MDCLTWTFIPPMSVNPFDLLTFHLEPLNVLSILKCDNVNCDHHENYCCYLLFKVFNYPVNPRWSVTSVALYKKE